MKGTLYVTQGYSSVRNGFAPDCIGALFNFANKGYSVGNADFDMSRYSTVRYGKHSIRYLGPHLWSRLPSSDRQRPLLVNFRWNIRKKDLISLIEGTCINCNLCITKPRLQWDFFNAF